MAVKSLLKKALRTALGDYEYWKIFAIDLPQNSTESPENCVVRQISGTELRGFDDPGLKNRAEYDGPESIGFGLFVSGELACIQWYWWGARYTKERSGRSWELPPGSAKSIGLYTVPEYRGRGLATVLKQKTAVLMYERGFLRLYSRIWHNHADSIRVSKKAGWIEVGSYVEICPLGKKRYCFRFRKRSSLR